MPLGEHRRNPEPMIYIAEPVPGENLDMQVRCARSIAISKAKLPTVDAYDWPEPEEGDEDDDPLYDSSRDYLDQIARYREHQGKSEDAGFKLMILSAKPAESRSSRAVRRRGRAPRRVAIASSGRRAQQRQAGNGKCPVHEGGQAKGLK
jgi:hypothetical protein